MGSGIDTLENGRVHDEYHIHYLREHIKAMKDAYNIRWCRFNGLYILGMY